MDRAGVQMMMFKSSDLKPNQLKSTETRLKWYLERLSFLSICQNTTCRFEFSVYTSIIRRDVPQSSSDTEVQWLNFKSSAMIRFSPWTHTVVYIQYVTNCVWHNVCDTDYIFTLRFGFFAISDLFLADSNRAKYRRNTTSGIMKNSS